MPFPLLAVEYAHRQAFTWDHAAITADTTRRRYKVPAGRKLRIESVDYVNPTGLAANGSNFVVLTVLKNATTAASLSTAAITIAADTVTALTLSGTDANLVLEGGDTLSFFVDATGTVTLPADGTFVVHARWVQ